MKALIISFFCVILGYSFFFNDKNSKVESTLQMDMSSENIDAKIKPYFISDTIDYFAKQNELIYDEDFPEQFF